MTTDDELLSPLQVAKRLNTSRSTVYSAMHDGLLPYYRLSSRRGTKGKLLVKLADALAWLESNRHGARGADGSLAHIRHP